MRTFAAVVAMILVLPSVSQSQERDTRLPAPGLTSLGNGRWRLTVEQLVPPSDYVHEVEPPCDTDYGNGLEAMLRSFATPSDDDPRLAIVFPILFKLAGELERFARSQPGLIAQILSPDRKATCVPMGVRTGPAVIHKVTYSVSDGERGAGQCQTNLPSLLACEPIGWAGWEDYVAGSGQQVQVGFVSTFKNWSHDRHRWANISIDFAPTHRLAPRLIQ